MKKPRFRNNLTNNNLEVHLNGISYENKIRSLEVSNLVSEIATVDELRKQMVLVQHALGLKQPLSFYYSLNL